MDWPEPFDKSANETHLLQIIVRPVASDRWMVNLEYGEEIRAALAFSGPMNALQLERGELRIGAGEAKLPDQPGLAVAARLPRWAWTLPIETPSPVGEGGAGKTPSPQRGEGWGGGLIRSLDARIGELILAGQTFTAVTVNAARYAEGLRIDLDSKALPDG
jgi:uncharacterized protein YhdP